MLFLFAVLFPLFTSILLSYFWEDISLTLGRPHNYSRGLNNLLLLCLHFAPVIVVFYIYNSATTLKQRLIYVLEIGIPYLLLMVPVTFIFKVFTHCLVSPACVMT